MFWLVSSTANAAGAREQSSSTASSRESVLFIVLSIILAPIIVEFGLDVIDVIVNLGKWNHAELAKVLHTSHQRVSTLKKKDFKVTGHGNCGKMEAGSLLHSRSS